MSAATKRIESIEKRGPAFGASARNAGCEVCGSYPVISETGMCGPCTFGEADAIGEGDMFDEGEQGS